MKKIVIILLGFMVVVFLLLLLRSGNQKRPNIIFITIDALRADHLGCYGYQRNTSPNIDALAKQGVMFNKCFSSSNATVRSFPGILTGRYLAVIKKNYAFYNNNLDNKFNTLAEYLKKEDYFTAAFIKNAHLRIKQGFEQGFDCYENVDDDAQAMTVRVLDFLKKYQNNKPFFIWIHYLDLHVPYAFLPEYFKQFENDELYKKNDKILKFNPEDNLGPYDSFGSIPKVAFRENKYNLNYYIACYDAGILYTDFYIGKLLKNIKDNTIIILTADHGESLGEHNSYFSHEVNIFDELLHVPLIIKDNRYFKAGRKISTAVSSVDIVPTILSRIDPFWYFFNKNKFDGIDLRGMLNGKNIGRRYIYSYFPWAWSIRDVKENIKYILYKNGRGRLYLFPDENTNYIKDNSARITKIREELRINLKKWIEAGYPIAADINSKKIFYRWQNNGIVEELRLS